MSSWLGKLASISMRQLLTPLSRLIRTRSSSRSNMITITLERPASAATTAAPKAFVIFKPILEARKGKFSRVTHCHSLSSTLVSKWGRHLSSPTSRRLLIKRIAATVLALDRTRLAQVRPIRNILQTSREAIHPTSKSRVLQTRAGNAIRMYWWAVAWKRVLCNCKLLSNQNKTN